MLIINTGIWPRVNNVVGSTLANSQIVGVHRQGHAALAEDGWAVGLSLIIFLEDLCRSCAYIYRHHQTPVSATLSNTIAIIVLVDPSIHVQPAWQRRLPPTLETVSIIFREEEKGTSNTRGYSLAMFSDKPTWRKIGAPKEQREMNTTMAGSYVVQWCSWCGNESGMSSNES